MRGVVGRINLGQLKERFPGVARAILRAERRAACREIRRERRAAMCSVGWHRVGAVWAMDHTQVEGCAALCVRDLASQKVLHGDLGPDLGTAHVLGVLARLFGEHGAPLSIKSDNGSAFIAEDTKELLEEWGVLPLYSPPGCPAYNGSVECGIRWLKETALDLALVRGGSPGDRLGEAVDVLNAQVKRGRKASPDRQWQQRCPITVAERRRMHRLVDGERLRRRVAEGIASDARLTHAEAASGDRYAVPEALKILGVLQTQRP